MMRTLRYPFTKPLYAFTPTRRLLCHRSCTVLSFRSHSTDRDSRTPLSFRPHSHRRNLNRGRRTYYSQERERPPPFSTAESAILSSALSHVPTHGFTDTALSHGSRDAGYLEASLNLFPRGPFDLVNYHLVTQRLALKDTVQFPEGKHLGVGAKVRTLVLHRLRVNQDIIRHWQQVG